MKQVLSKFNSRPLTCDPALFPGKNNLNIEKSNRIFPWKGRGHKAFILTYLDSPTVEVFLPCLFSAIFFRLSSGGNRGWKFDQKYQVLVNFFPIKTRILQKKSQTFSLLEHYLWWEFRQYWTLFGGARTQTPTKKNIGCWIGTQSLWKF